MRPRRASSHRSRTPRRPRSRASFTSSKGARDVQRSTESALREGHPGSRSPGRRLVKGTTHVRGRCSRLSRTRSCARSRRRRSSRCSGSTRSSARLRCRLTAAIATTPAGTCSASTHQPGFQAPFGYYDADVNRRRLTWSSRRGRAFLPSETVDFVIVGSGAAGGIIAKELSTAGLLGRRARAGAAADRGRSSITTSSARSCRASTPTIRRRSRRRSARRRADKARNSLALIYGRMVGGSNAHFTGNFWRLRPIDFNEASMLGGVPGTGLVDWPITLRGARAVLHEGRVGARRVG